MRQRGKRLSGYLLMEWRRDEIKTSIDLSFFFLFGEQKQKEFSPLSLRSESLGEEFFETSQELRNQWVEKI